MSVLSGQDHPYFARIFIRSDDESRTMVIAGLEDQIWLAERLERPAVHTEKATDGFTAAVLGVIGKLT